MRKSFITNVLLCRKFRAAAKHCIGWLSLSGNLQSLQFTHSNLKAAKDLTFSFWTSDVSRTKIIIRMKCFPSKWPTFWKFCSHFSSNVVFVEFGVGKAFWQYQKQRFHFDTLCSTVTKIYYVKSKNKSGIFFRNTAMRKVKSRQCVKKTRKRKNFREVIRKQRIQHCPMP